MTRKSAAEIERDIDATRADISRTLDALRDRLSPGQMLDNFLGISRTGPTLVSQGVARTFRNYPVPATLIGAGLWMMMSGRSGGREKPDSFSRRYEPPRPTPRGDVRATAGGGTGYGWTSYDRPGFQGEPGENANSSRSAASAEGQDSGSATQKLREQATQMTDKVREQTTQLTDKVREQTSQLTDKVSATVSNTAQQAREQVQGYADQARGYAAQAREMTQQNWDMAQSKAQDFVSEYPLVAGALVAAVGAVLGSLIPISRRERELLGEQGAQLRDVARDAMAQGREAVGHIAEAAVSKTREEAKGLSENLAGQRQQGNGQAAVH